MTTGRSSRYLGILFLASICGRSSGFLSSTVYCPKLLASVYDPWALHSVPSWTDLERQIGPSYQVEPPVSVDPAINTDPGIPPFSTDRPVLFRERHGWCPYSERVWITLELHDIAYDTIKIDNMGGPQPSYYSGQTPQMKWANGCQQGESMDLVTGLDERYKCGLRSTDKAVQELVSAFRTIFPRARPSSRAAFLFQNNGEPLGKSTFEDTLAATDALLSKTDGPFFAGGDQVTAADIAWCPFLERYRYQLPCLHEGLEPDNAAIYPSLHSWYQAMDQIPAYACRVKGDASSWRKVLTMAGFGNSGLPPQIDQNMQDLREKEVATAQACLLDQDVWGKYAASREHAPATPAADAAAIVIRNRQAIVKDTLRRATDRTWKETDLPRTAEEIDETLREMVDVLLNDDYDLLTNASRRSVGSMASFLDERMCVPRDMGVMSAAAIKVLAWKLQTYN
jgi:glutathione S-transferase